jgi:oligopeptide/dipeptide ABC transporter ATP-binding protein
VRGKEVAMIFQEPMTALNPVQRVGRQIMENLLLHEPLDKRGALRRAVELMEWVGIPAPEQRVNEYPHQLSGGMRQRVMIAMALSCGPKVLIADEPTTALDVTVQAQILDLIKRLQKETGMAVILITHDLGVVAETCDEVAVMYAGRIVERGPVEAIFKRPLHPYTKGLMACLPKMDHPPKTPLPVIPGMVPTLRDMPVGCRFAARCPNAHEESVTGRRQPWKECGGGHGVEACACFAKEVETCGEIGQSSEGNRIDEKQTGTNPSGALESALAYLGAGAGADPIAPGGERRAQERSEQFGRLLEWAGQQGRLIPGERWLTPEELGAEHRIYFDSARQCAIKLTNTGQAGMTYCFGEPVAATPFEYLRRWQMHNELFGDQVWLEGIVDTASGPCLAIGQPWIEGGVPEAADIAGLMSELGFERTADPEHFFRPTDGLMVMDCHEGNFIAGVDGLLYPIDVIPVRGDKALIAKLSIDS